MKATQRMTTRRSRSWRERGASIFGFQHAMIPLLQLSGAPAFHFEAAEVAKEHARVPALTQAVEQKFVEQVQPDVEGLSAIDPAAAPNIAALGPSMAAPRPAPAEAKVTIFDGFPAGKSSRPLGAVMAAKYSWVKSLLPELAVASHRQKLCAMRVFRKLGEPLQAVGQRQKQGLQVRHILELGKLIGRRRRQQTRCAVISPRPDDAKSPHALRSRVLRSLAELGHSPTQNRPHF